MLCSAVVVQDHRRPQPRRGFSPHRTSVVLILCYLLTDVKLILAVIESSQLHRVSEVTLLDRSSPNIIDSFTHARCQYQCWFSSFSAVYLIKCLNDFILKFQKRCVGVGLFFLCCDMCLVKYLTCRLYHFCRFALPGPRRRYPSWLITKVL